MNNRKEYIVQINRVKKYIEENVDQKLPLTKLAEKANYSPFHFQRIFKSIAGETPKQYIKRIRIERTTHHIFLKPETSLLEVALQYGFTSLAAFSNAFKNYYEISPDTFRKSTEEDKMSIISKKIKLDGHKGIDTSMFLSAFINNDSEQLKVEIVKMLPKKLIYISVTLKDIETVVNGYKRIKKWANARDLINSNTEVFGLMQDYPAFTALEKCRFATCVSVEREPAVSGEINYKEIPSRTYATFKIKGGINELIKSVTKFVKQWLPDSGYEINHVPAILVPNDDPITNHPHNITYQFYLALTPK